jgi:hypothetical protein
MCERVLNKNDELILLNGEYFRCHLCGHDLAAYAYRQDAYHEQHWLPVIYALNDLQAEEKCVRCRFLGAMARACQIAVSRTSKLSTGSSRLLTMLLRRTDWTEPSEGCESTCFAVRQYRATAGEHLLVL